MDNRDSAHAHCKACDNMFYPSWNGNLNGFEELCWTCLSIADMSAESGFNFGTLRDTMVVSDSLYEQDPYLEGGSESMGELNLWEKV
jgi:hypothetical protein